MSRQHYEENKIRPHILTTALYFAVVIMMLYQMILNRIYDNKGAFFTSLPIALYSLFYTLYVFAVQKAVYVMVRVRARRSQYLNAQSNMRRSLSVFAIGAIFAGAAIILGSYVIATKVLYAERTFFPVLISGISILFLGSSGVIRGYLQGVGYTKPIVISDLLVSISSMVFGVIASLILYNYGLKVNNLFHVDDLSSAYGSVVALFGILLGSIIGFIQNIISYNLRRHEIEEFVKSGAPRYLDNKNDVLIGVRPIIYLYCTPAIVAIFDQCFYCIYNGLTGADADFITNYGIYSGKIIVVVIFVSLLCCIPFIKDWNRVMARIERDEFGAARDRYRKLLRFSNMIYIPASVFCFCVPGTIIVSLFGKSSKEANSLMMLAAIAIYLVTFGMVFSWHLNHIGKAMLFSVNLTLALIVNVIATIVFVVLLKMGIMGIALANVIGVGIYDALCLWMLNRMLRHRPDYIREFLIPFVASALSGLLAFLLNNLLVNVVGDVLTLIVCLIIFWFLYMILMIVTRCIRTSELSNIPMGKLFRGISESIQGRGSN